MVKTLHESGMRIGELKCQNENCEDKQNELEAKIQDLEAENKQLKDLLGKCVFMHLQWHLEPLISSIDEKV